jgi:16S rRNA (adenine1518-N6/adenine1519-N6)-dimethyltransferase
MKHVARKRFGQNFLTDDHVLHNIIEGIDPRRGDTMVEIGPGLAAMTALLLKELDHMHVVELDRDLVARLEKTYPREQLAIHAGDALKFDFGSIPVPEGKKLRVVGNLPYNISSPILFHLLQFVARIEDQHFMLQKEVVDRMVAAPATADYGRLSVMLQWRYAMENVLFVPPEAFDPPPKVDSAVVRMVPYPQPAAIDEALLSELVQVAFSQRRKILRHTLGRWLEQRGFAGQFDVQRRAEEVPVAEYLALCAAIPASRP